VQSEGQPPAAESVVHQLAKPLTRARAWSAVAAAVLALTLGARRNLLEP
jgi:hypothetical protein